MASNRVVSMVAAGDWYDCAVLWWGGVGWGGLGCAVLLGGPSRQRQGNAPLKLSVADAVVEPTEVYLV